MLKSEKCQINRLYLQIMKLIKIDTNMSTDDYKIVNALVCHIAKSLEIDLAIGDIVTHENDTYSVQDINTDTDRLEILDESGRSKIVEYEEVQIKEFTMDNLITNFSKFYAAEELEII